MDIISGGSDKPICQINYNKEKLHGPWGESFGYSEMNILNGVCNILATYYFINPLRLINSSNVEITTHLIKSNSDGALINFDRQNRFIDVNHLNTSTRVNYKPFEHFNLPSEIIMTIENQKKMVMTKSLILFRNQYEIPVPLTITGGLQEGTHAFKMLDLKFQFHTCQVLK